MINNIFGRFFLLVLITTVSCSKDSEPTPTPVIIPVDNYNKTIFPNLVFDASTLVKMKEELSTNTTAAQKFSQWVTAIADESLPITALTGGLTSKEPGYIYALSVQWAVNRENRTVAAKYQEKAVSILKYWVQTNKPTDHTPNETAILPLLEGYSIIRNTIGNADRISIDNWLKTRAIYYKSLTANANRKNNWETIRINYLYDISLLLGDDVLYNDANTLHSSHINFNLLANGLTSDYIERDAFAYHAYNLSFLGRICKAVSLYKGQTVGSSFFNTVSTKGGSIPKSISFWTPYMLNPADFPHIEFTNTVYKPDLLRVDANKQYNPLGTTYALDHLIYINPATRQTIETLLPNTTRYNRNFVYWIDTFPR